MTTQKAERTPGPWFVYNEPLRPQLGMQKIIEIQDAYGEAIVPWSGFDACDFPTKIKLANARFIAAAPETAAERDRLRETVRELIAALKEIKNSNNSKWQADRAWAAMARAEGCGE